MKPKDLKNYNRRDFIRFSAITGLGLSLNLYSCTKDTQPDTGDNKDDDDIITGLHLTGVSISSYILMDKGGSLEIQGKGFAQNDQIVFRSLSHVNANYTLDIEQISEGHIRVVLPIDFASGKYRVSARRGQSNATIGDTTLEIVFNANIPDKAGMTIKGTVYAGGAGIAGVIVSDGIEVVTTDSNGTYHIPSAKKNGYVFVSIPGNYEVARDGSLPLFFNRLTSPAGTVEIKDFELTPTDNDKHVVMVLGDMHLANRNNDIAQFQRGFLTDVNQSILKYKGDGTKVYALTLGDMTWETYWQQNSYALPEYLKEVHKINAPVFHTIGNHDNDPTNVGDWDTAGKFRTTIGPNYYSFNLGKVHYIVLDNIEYLNTDNRNYNGTIVAEQMDWLRKDLALITDKSTPIVIAMHIQLFSNPNINGGNESRTRRLSNSQELIDALNGFTKVHLLTGHTHMNYNIRYSPSIMEHNLGAVCATWWWTGRDGYAGNHICKDGTPGGYGIWEIADKDLKWHYKSIGYDSDYQFRAFDLNKVHLTKETYASAYTGTAWATYAVGYANPNLNNEVLINVWNYDTDWSVEVTEGGNALPVTRVHVEDPLHIISYSAKRLNVNAVPTADFVSAKTAHMFKVKAASPTSTLEIKVTDCFGNIYRETMVRPKAFGYLMR